MHTSTRVRRLLAGGTTLAVAATLAATLGSPTQAAPSSGSAPDARGDVQQRRDNFPNPLARKQNKLRKEALELLARGKTQPEPQRGGGSTITTQSGEAVELFDNDKQANVWTVLSEFGDEITESGGDPGPLHNDIAKPDPDMDNTTQWTDDFNVTHYDTMFNATEGESFRNYYLDQSNGEYTTTVKVEDWVQVPKNGYYYGDNSHEAEGYWAYINDTVDAWYAEASKGRTDAELKAYLAEFDKWDRYDFDEDGNFNEADGYIDHFQAIHAGEGEEAGGGTLGDYAIWSHRWYADYTTIGQEGPTVGDRQNLMGGQEIGNTGMYVGDYTVEPENGGLGVFAHEYGHDLGLPDFYDTSGGGENSTGFWTLMSSGSWMGHGEEATGFQEGIGGTPNDMGPEEKLFLGWLHPQVVEAGDAGRHTLRPAGDPASNDAVQVMLPDVEQTRVVGEPFAGERAWYSDAGDDLNNSLTRDVPAAESVTVDAMAWWDTEADYDYWYAQYSTDGGSTWQQLDEFDGQSGGWVPQSFTYQPGGQESKFRFLYRTDGGVSNPGVMLDEIKTTINGTNVLDTDGAETDSSAWTSNSWLRTTGTITQTFPRYYLMENKSYVNYDDTLRTGPYNFSEAYTRPNWVQHFPYQDGLLVWFVNHSVADNNTSQHPGSGYALPVDAMPELLRWSDGLVARNRIQAFDSTFGVETTDRVRLTRQAAVGQSGAYDTHSLTAPARSMASTFTDRKPNRYWTNANPTGSVKVAGVGVTARVISQASDTLVVRVANPE